MLEQLFAENLNLARGQRMQSFMKAGRANMTSSVNSLNGQADVPKNEKTIFKNTLKVVPRSL